jgi:aconitate hydratase
MEGENKETLELTGEEVYHIEGITDKLSPGQRLTITAKAPPRVKRRDENGNEKQFQVIARLDTQVEVDYYRNGGILQTVLRNLLAS